MTPQIGSISEYYFGGQVNSSNFMLKYVFLSLLLCHYAYFEFFALAHHFYPENKVVYEKGTGGLSVTAYRAQIVIDTDW